MRPWGEDDSRHLRHVLLLVSQTADGMIRSSDSEVVREISLTVVLIGWVGVGGGEGGGEGGEGGSMPHINYR